MALKTRHTDEDPRDELSVGSYIKYNDDLFLVLESDTVDCVVQRVKDDGIKRFPRYKLRAPSILVKMAPKISPEEEESLSYRRMLAGELVEA